MKISVLVPVYGVEKYSARCAESLFSQTYRDLEFVFVDDCTPDRSIDILRSVAGRHPEMEGRVRIIRHEQNKGLAAARRTALASAMGDCVIHVDSDDYLPPQAVEALVRRMDATGADIVDGAWLKVTPDGSEIHMPPCRVTSKERYLAMMLCQNVVPHNLCGRLVRRSVYTDYGVDAVPGVDNAEDYSVMPRLLFYASRTFIDDVVYYYSDENTSSYTHTMSPKHVRSYIRANRVVLDFFSAGDRLRRYSAPLQIGLLNVLRNVRANKFSFAEADSLLGYVPRGLLFRLVAAMLRGKCPFRLAEAAYLALRRAYVSTVAGGRSERG